MRVLFVTHRFPGAAFRGDQVRARAQIRELSQRHQIHLLSFEQLPDQHPAVVEMRACCSGVTMVARNRVAMGLRAVLALMRARPIQQALFDSPALQRALVDLCSERTPKFDLVHVQLARLAGLIHAVPSAPIVVDFVDALSVNMMSRAEQAGWPMAALWRMEGRRLRNLERSVLADADACVVSSGPDAEALGHGTAGRSALAAPDRLTVAPNGVDLDRFGFAADGAAGANRVGGSGGDPDAGFRQHLVFHGNWAYAPNQSGLRWLVDEVLPQVWQTHPEVRLRLVGVQSSRIKGKVRDPRIDVVGAVASPAAALQDAAVSVAPLHAGSGQSLKILEAMACGAPVVTTSRAAFAIQRDGVCPCRVADSPDQFAGAIIDLLNNAEAARALARDARIFVESAFTWAHSNAVLEAAWTRAIGRVTNQY